MASLLVPPLSLLPESFTRVTWAFPVGERMRTSSAFQRCLTRPVRVPERFRGGCSFGAVATGCGADSPGGICDNWNATRWAGLSRPRGADPRASAAGDRDLEALQGR